MLSDMWWKRRGNLPFLHSRNSSMADFFPIRGTISRSSPRRFRCRNILLRSRKTAWFGLRRCSLPWGRGKGRCSSLLRERAKLHFCGKRRNALQSRQRSFSSCSDNGLRKAWSLNRFCRMRSCFPLPLTAQIPNAYSLHVLPWKGQSGLPRKAAMP